ncbi:hypothetical protein Q3G72_002819 [Acer saccharum]|nr:hypothetical protein Q3G72_002819 [Acer saccharum]
MNDIEEEEELLTTWSQMIDQYNVHDNNWMSSIFDVRAKWAYAYVRRAWSAGMRSTQLSESFNASLKDYLNSVILKIPYKILSQAREVYMKAIFEEFQEQLLEAIELVITNCVEDDGKLFYTVDTENSSKMRQPPSQLSPMVVDFPYPLSHSPTYKFQQQLQGCSASNPMANTPYERSQQPNFQALLQQNMQNFTSAFQDSQTSNSSSLLE